MQEQNGRLRLRDRLKMHRIICYERFVGQGKCEFDIDERFKKLKRMNVVLLRGTLEKLLKGFYWNHCQTQKEDLLIKIYPILPERRIDLCDVYLTISNGTGWRRVPRMSTWTQSRNCRSNHLPHVIKTYPQRRFNHLPCSNQPNFAHSYWLCANKRMLGWLFNITLHFLWS